MAFKLGDRARETSTAPGTGSFTVNGAVQGAQSLASVLTSNADTGWYFATNGTGWEVGPLTRTSATVYARGTPFASSNGGALVNFSTGLVDIALDLPASVLDTLNLTEITVASATTTDIGAVQGAKIVISGTTTITGLGTSANKLRFVRFSGALTLTHNGTSLILPGAANIVTVAGDTAVFTSDASGNWTCRSYDRGTLAPIDGAAWTAYTPTITATTGTFTTVSATGFYKVVGKRVDFRAVIVITTIGSAAGRVLCSIPTGTIVAIAAGNCVGVNGGNGAILAGTAFFDTNTTFTIVKATDASFPGTTGQTLYVSGFYEMA